MAMSELEIARNESSKFIVQVLPDGSAAIFEVATRNVYSLNPSAAAAWEACASATTLSQLATAMSRRLEAPVTEDLAHEAVSELAAVGLVRVTPAERLGTSRRELLKQVAEVGIPMVLVLTGAQQRAHAQGAGSFPSSGTTSTTAPPGTTAPPASVCPSITIEFVKGVNQPDGSVVPLAGAVFNLLGPANNVVTTLTTDANGRAKVVLTNVGLGTYKLVEVSAPGGPFEPFTPRDVVIDQFCSDWNRDLHNIPLTTTPAA